LPHAKFLGEPGSRAPAERRGDVMHLCVREPKKGEEKRKKKKRGKQTVNDLLDFNFGSRRATMMREGGREIHSVAAFRVIAHCPETGGGKRRQRLVCKPDRQHRGWETNRH